MARIRTIKPEFWQNETLAGLHPHARLLAIALLNHADDAGYFLANAALVRAACFPFEECSKNVLGSLQELSRIGYVEVRNCDGKQIGRVVKFKEHQRIDKPQKSKLDEVFCRFTNENNDSKNVPGMFLEPSENVPRLERKGKEEEGNREQGNGKDICADAQQPKKRFLPPTLEEVVGYCQARSNPIDPSAFFDHYTAQGWKLSNGRMMVDWQSAVRKWERNRNASLTTVLKTFEKQKQENSREALQEWLENG